MTTLEQRYRQLFRAYPADHRRHREDEMVGALLDSSAPGQSWPDLRQAAAIVANGWRVRASSATEWQAGVAIAAVVATACAAAMAVSLVGLGVLSPFDPAGALGPAGWAPVAVWGLAAMALLAATMVGRWTAAAVIAGSIAVVVFAGTDLIGVRRAVGVPFACLVLIAAAGRAVPGPRRAARLGALGAGALVGAGLVVRFVHQLDAWSRFSPGSPWAYVSRWAYATWVLDLPDETWWALVVVAAAAGLVRPRFAVAGALLCVPLLPLTTGVYGLRLGSESAARLVAVLIVLLGVALVRGWLAYRPERPSGEPGEG